MKKLLALALAIIMLLGLVACSKNSAETTPSTTETTEQTETASASGTSYKDEIVIGAAADVTTTDPQASNTDSNMMLFCLTHETLFEIDQDTGEVHCGMLESYSQVSDLEYEFVLPANAVFSDGTPCTASDVKFTLERAANSSFTSTKVASIASMEVVNDTTLRVTVSEPNQDFLLYLAHRSLSILSEKAVTEKGDEGAAMGTGMFQLDEWVPGDHISVVRNDNYYGELAKTRKITFRLITENSSRLIALQTGEIDVCLEPSAIETGYIADDPNLELIQLNDIRLTYLAFNTTKEPFNNPKVRQALAHAIDKSNIILAGMEGLGSAYNTVLNVGQFGVDYSISGYDYDLEKAKELLDEAGYPDGFTFDITVSTSSRALMAQVIQADMAKIGVTVNINQMESAAQKALLNEGGHEAVIYSWTDADGSDFTLRSMFYTGSGSNRSLFSDSWVDEMIDKALVETDSDTRAEMYKELQQYIVDACPIVPICTSITSIGANAKVQGVVWMNSNKHDFRNVYVEE